MCSKAACTLVYSRDESSCIFASVHVTSVHRCSRFLAKHLSSRLHGIIFKKRTRKQCWLELIPKRCTNGCRSTQVRKETDRSRRALARYCSVNTATGDARGTFVTWGVGGGAEAEQSDLVLDFRAKSSGYLCRLEFETRSIKNFNTEICKRCSKIHQTRARRMYSINSPCRNLNLRFFFADNYAVN